LPGNKCVPETNGPVYETKGYVPETMAIIAEAPLALVGES
jgi:hypothetical protein